jgi:hypothetical protein
MNGKTIQEEAAQGFDTEHWPTEIRYSAAEKQLVVAFGLFLTDIHWSASKPLGPVMSFGSTEPLQSDIACAIVVHSTSTQLFASKVIKQYVPGELITRDRPSGQEYGGVPPWPNAITRTWKVLSQKLCSGSPKPRYEVNFCLGSLIWKPTTAVHPVASVTVT